VSTNSITQGEQTALVWKTLMEGFKVKIDFAYRTFRWTSAARGKAAVHCVIVGFSHSSITAKRRIFEADLEIEAGNINPYLVDAPNVYIENRKKPLCDVPLMGIGNKPIDDGNYLFTKEEMEEFVVIEPEAVKYFRPWYGSHEFINNCPRYCLWLGDCTPTELSKMPHAMKRVDNVRKYRLASPSEGTRKIAATPRRFHVENMPDGDYLLIPSVSSENRDYIPIGFMTKDVIASNLALIVPGATLYHFGVLTSSTHMAWVRAVCGRLESRYRYSAGIVYNNFPWPEPNEKQRQAIEAAAQGVLDARDGYPGESFANLYDPNKMPSTLAKAHRALDNAVKNAYGGKGFASEAERVADLMERYRRLADKASSD
jgi:hypothetical protein